MPVHWVEPVCAIATWHEAGGLAVFTSSGRGWWVSGQTALVCSAGVILGRNSVFVPAVCTLGTLRTADLLDVRRK